MNSKYIFPKWQREMWYELPGNPVIGHFEGDKTRYAIGDPQIILPGELDNKWHMFFHANKGGTESNEGSYNHCISDDGISWEFKKVWDWHYGPSFITCDGEKWILFYTEYFTEDMKKYDNYRADTIIRARWTYDFKIWSEPVDILMPETEWEREGEKIQARNPCVVKMDDNCYRLYYSAGTVWLDDCGYEEPKYIGCAESLSILGPYTKRNEPIIAPDTSIKYRNFGAGAIKVYKYGDYFLGLYNPIYKDDLGHSRSAISVILSDDGIEWSEAPYNPIIIPTEKWKKAIVYQLDLRQYNGKLWLYYNARDEWQNGVERIGCSVLNWKGIEIKKMWDIPKIDSEIL